MNSNMMQGFINFMNQNKGKDPNVLLNQMIRERGLSQAQLNQVQRQAQQMSGMFNSIRNMFGF